MKTLALSVSAVARNPKIWGNVALRSNLNYLLRMRGEGNCPLKR